MTKKTKKGVINSPLKNIFKKTIVDEIRATVPAINQATVLVSLFANVILREILEGKSQLPMEKLFDPNFIAFLFYAVSTKCTDKELTKKFEDYFPDASKIVPPKAYAQHRMYSARSLASTAKTNIYYHLRERVKKVVKATFAFEHEVYSQYTKEQKIAHKVMMLQIQKDVLRLSNKPCISPEEHHEWIGDLRKEMKIDHISQNIVNKLVAINRRKKQKDDDDDDQEEEQYENAPSMIYYAKCNPHEFVIATAVLSSRSPKGFSLFPIRRSMIPKYIHIDIDILQMIDPNMTRSKAEAHALEYRGGTDIVKKEGAKRARRSPTDPSLTEQKRFVFQSAMTKSAYHHFYARHVDKKKDNPYILDWSVKTDGYGASVTVSKRRVTSTDDTTYIKNGVMKIADFRDKYSATNALGDMTVTGIDPGKREIISAVNYNDHDIKYSFTKGHQDHMTGAKRYQQMMKKERPDEITNADKIVEHPEDTEDSTDQGDLTVISSKAVPLDGFLKYATLVVQSMHIRCVFYEKPVYRQRRWKRKLRLTRVYANVVNNLKKLQRDSTRRMVLAYGSWGMASSGFSPRGLPPTIGIGMIRYLAKYFPVVITPEHYTSKTCPCCDHEVGRCTHAELARKNPYDSKNRRKEIRGLRYCPGCNMHFNRDHMGATNIAENFVRIYQNLQPIRAHTAGEQEMIALEQSTS